MPRDEQVTITVNDDGTIDIGKFKDDANLSKIKGVIDGLRSENAGHRTKIKELEPQVGKLADLEAQVAEWSGKVAMTPEEKAAFDKAVKDLEAFGDLEPEKAKEALAYQGRRTKQDAITQAFEAAGLNAKAALNLQGVTDLETRVQTEEKDGKAVKVAQVKVGDEWKPLDKHVEAEYSDFMPVLKPSEKKTGSSPIDSVRPGSNKAKPSSLEGAITEHYNQ